MTTVTASEFQKNFGEFKEKAQRAPVEITSNGRNSVVLISAADYEEFQKLRFQKTHAYGGDVTDAFTEDLNAFMSEHQEVLEGLAK